MPGKDDQIVDSILSVNEIVLGSSASKSMSTMYLNLAQSTGMATQNAVSNQQHLNIIGMAATAASVSGILRTNLSDQVEKLTLEERVNYLKSLLSLGATYPVPDDKTSTQKEVGSTDDKTADGSNIQPSVPDEIDAGTR